VERLGVPYHPIAAVDSLFGIGPADARALVGEHQTTGPEVEELLDLMPHLLRSLSTRTEVVTQRCIGHIPGPIRWAETASTRAGSLSSGEVWVCSVVQRTSDVPENRILVNALELIAEGGDAVARAVPAPERSSRQRTAIERGRLARKFRQHGALKSVKRSKIDGRTLVAMRRSRQSGDYRAAHALIEAQRATLPARLIEETGTAHDRLTHHVFAEILDALGRADLDVPPLRTHSGRLGAGTVIFRHQSRAAHFAPITVGPVEVLVGPGPHHRHLTQAGSERPVVIEASSEVRAGVKDVLRRLGRDPRAASPSTSQIAAPNSAPPRAVTSSN